MTFLGLVLAQLGVVDYFLFTYAREKHWAVEPQVIISFLGATVAKVLGVATIMVRYLFGDD